MRRDQSLFLVQQKGGDKVLSRKSRTNLQKVKVFLPNIAKTCILMILMCKVLSMISFRNLDAESAGIQGRKSLLREKPQPVDEVAESRYDEMLHARLRDIDLESLSEICGLPRDANLSICRGRGKHTEDTTMLGDDSIFPRIYVLGERHSGTNAAADLVHANFKLSLVSKSFIHRKYPWVKETELQREFGLNSHKHNIQEDHGYYPGLSIISIRNPYDWVRSMMRECYFCDSAQMRTISKGIKEFVNSPWTKGAHILSGEYYENIFDLRVKKFCNHLVVAYKRSDCVLITRAEENILSRQQRSYIFNIANMTMWKRTSSEPKVLRAYLGRGSDASFNSLKYFTESLMLYPQSDVELVNAVKESMNVRFETALGY